MQPVYWYGGDAGGETQEVELKQFSDKLNC